MKKFICASVFLFCLFLPFSLSKTTVGEDNKSNIAKVFWEGLQNISVSFPDTKNFNPANENNRYYRTIYYWTTLQEKCMYLFFTGFSDAVKNNQIEKFARDYASYFGTAGDESDLRWCMACPILANNSFVFIKEGDPRKSSLWANNKNQTSYWVFTPEFQRFACEFNKTIIERSLASKEIYGRMYWFTMWCAENPLNLCNKNEYFDSIKRLFEIIEEGLRTDKSDPKFWFAIRWVLVLAYLCRQESIFNDIKESITPDKILSKLRPVGDNVRMLFSTSMLYSKDEGRFVPVDPRLPPFDLPKKPFPVQEDTLTTKKVTIRSAPKDIDPITSDMFIEIIKGFNTKFLEKVRIEKPMNK